MEDGNDVVQVWRALNIGGAAVLAGMVSVNMYRYLPMALRGTPLTRHILLVGISYIIFICNNGFTQYEKIADGEGFTFRLLSTPVAIVLGIVSFIIMLKDLERRKQRGLDRRETDPT